MRDFLKWVVLPIVVAAALVGAAFVLGVSELLKGSEQDPMQSAIASESGVGMPLDAVQYPAPTWVPNARQCFRVVDRKSGCAWWVICVPNYGKYEWIVLPIEGKVESVG